MALQGPAGQPTGRALLRSQVDYTLLGLRQTEAEQHGLCFDSILCCYPHLRLGSANEIGCRAERHSLQLDVGLQGLSHPTQFKILGCEIHRIAQHEPSVATWKRKKALEKWLLTIQSMAEATESKRLAEFKQSPNARAHLYY